ANGDQRVGALRDGVRDDVLQLAGLVAAEGQAGVDVLALGPDLGAAEVLAQAGKVVDGAGTEGQRVAFKIRECHDVLVGLAAVRRSLRAGRGWTARRLRMQYIAYHEWPGVKGCANGHGTA